MFTSDQDFSETESIRQSGFVAQEVEQAAKSAGYDFNGFIAPKNNKQTYSLSYSQFVVPLVKAVQEQQQQIELLKQQNELLMKEIQLIKDKMK